MAGPSSACPILTLEIVYHGNPYYAHYRNQLQSSWSASSFNPFTTVIDISEGMSSASEAYFYFEKPPPDVDIILDFVQIGEYPFKLENINLFLMEIYFQREISARI